MKLQTTVSEEVGARVRELAAEDGRSVSAWLAVMVKEAVRRPKLAFWQEAPVLGEMIEGGKRRRMTEKDVAHHPESAQRFDVKVEAGQVVAKPVNPKLEGVDEVCPIGVNRKAQIAENERRKNLEALGK